MIIILGSTGFIGKALVNYFSQRKIPFLGVSSKEIDLTKKSSIEKLVKLFMSDSIVIFTSSIVREKGDNLENMQKNIDMARNVAKAIEIKPVKKLIFISSIDVYGNPKEIITEKTPLNPRSPYGISKLASEFILKLTSKTLKIPLLNLRLGGIFGPGQSQKKYGPNSFTQSAINKREISLYGDGKEIRDLVFINDLVKIITHLGLNKATGTINIASGNPVSFYDVAKLLQILLPSYIRIIKKRRSEPKSNFQFETSNLIRNLPKNFNLTPLKEALKITVDSAN